MAVAKSSVQRSHTRLCLCKMKTNYKETITIIIDKTVDNLSYLSQGQARREDLHPTAHTKHVLHTISVKCNKKHLVKSAVADNMR